MDLKVQKILVRPCARVSSSGVVGGAREAAEWASGAPYICRHPRAHKHVRDVFRVVHTNFKGDQRPWAITLRVIGQLFFSFPRFVSGGEQVTDFSELRGTGPNTTGSSGGVPRPPALLRWNIPCPGCQWALGHTTATGCLIWPAAHPLIWCTAAPF